MRVALKAHPDFPSDPVSGIEVEIESDDAGFTLRYTLAGAIAELGIPPISAPDRTDDLWRHTCFEAFLRPADGEAYFEFNFAPSTEWAAYQFAGYRHGMAPAEVAAPHVAIAATDNALVLTVKLDLSALHLPPGPCRLALSAVIEQASGEKSYWALAHPPGKPDFHHRESFACDLPGAPMRFGPP
jgi:hypothetical protein